MANIQSNGTSATVRQRFEAVWRNMKECSLLIIFALVAVALLGAAWWIWLQMMHDISMYLVHLRHQVRQEHLSFCVGVCVRAGK